MHICFNLNNYAFHFCILFVAPFLFYLPSSVPNLFAWSPTICALPLHCFLYPFYHDESIICHPLVFPHLVISIVATSYSLYTSSNFGYVWVCRIAFCVAPCPFSISSIAPMVIYISLKGRRYQSRHLGIFFGVNLHSWFFVM